MKQLKINYSIALLLASALLWVSCQKEVTNQVLQNSTNESQLLKSSGAIEDDPNAAMKVPLIMSSEFASRQFVTTSVVSTAGTALRGKQGSGGGTADITSPIVSFTSPANAQTFDPGVAVSVKVSASDNVGVKSVSFNANGTVIGTLTAAPYNFTWNTGSVDGSYTLTATAADAAGNKSSTSITVSVKTPIVILPPPVLPAAWQLTMPAVGYQGSESACVPFAVVYYARSAEQYYKSGASSYSYASNIFSPEFVYDQTKASSSCSSGSSLLTTLDFLVSKGSCTWQTMPYSSTDGCATLPNSTQTNEAANYKIKSYSKLLAGDQTGIKTLLASNHPLSFTFTADANFYNAGPGYIWNSYSSTLYGPHAVTLCGYDDNKHAYRAINQWNTTWGDAGYIWIDYDFLSTITYDLYKINL